MWPIKASSAPKRTIPPKDKTRTRPHVRRQHAAKVFALLVNSLAHQLFPPDLVRVQFEAVFHALSLPLAPRHAGFGEEEGVGQAPEVVAV